MKKLTINISASTFCETLIEFEKCIENNISCTYDWTMEDDDDAFQEFCDRIIEKKVFISSNRQLSLMSYVSKVKLVKVVTSKLDMKSFEKSIERHFSNRDKQQMVSKDDEEYLTDIINELYDNRDSNPSFFKAIFNLKDESGDVIATIFFKELENEIYATGLIKINKPTKNNLKFV